MHKKRSRKLVLDRETLRTIGNQDQLLNDRHLRGAVGGTDNSVAYCPGYSEVNSCVAQCGI